MSRWHQTIIIIFMILKAIIHRVNNYIYENDCLLEQDKTFTMIWTAVISTSPLSEGGCCACKQHGQLWEVVGWGNQYKLLDGDGVQTLCVEGCMYRRVRLSLHDRYLAKQWAQGWSREFCAKKPMPWHRLQWYGFPMSSVLCVLSTMKGTSENKQLTTMWPRDDYLTLAVAWNKL